VHRLKNIILSRPVLSGVWGEMKHMEGGGGRGHWTNSPSLLLLGVTCSPELAGDRVRHHALYAARGGRALPTPRSDRHLRTQSAEEQITLLSK
jgi:hypothetical protein